MASGSQLRPLIGFLLVAGLALAFVLFANEVMEGDVRQFDDMMFRLLRNSSEPAWSRMPRK